MLNNSSIERRTPTPPKKIISCNMNDYLNLQRDFHFTFHRKQRTTEEYVRLGKTKQLLPDAVNMVFDDLDHCHHCYYLVQWVVLDIFVDMVRIVMMEVVVHHQLDLSQGVVVHQVAVVVVVVVAVAGENSDKTRSFGEGVDKLIDLQKGLPAITQ